VCIGKIIKRLKPRRSKREKKVTREGGVVKRFWTDAPKSIESRELISFSCRFIFTSAENDDRFQRRRACSLSAEYIADGRVVCRAAVKCRYEPNLEREAEKSAELMKAIDTVLRTHGVAEYNGYYHSVSGLPDFFGSALDACYKSGEKIRFYDNQQSLLTPAAKRELCRLFDVD